MTRLNLALELAVKQIKLTPERFHIFREDHVIKIKYKDRKTVTFILGLKSKSMWLEANSGSAEDIQESVTGSGFCPMFLLKIFSKRYRQFYEIFNTVDERVKLEKASKAIEGCKALTEIFADVADDGLLGDK